jgi:hypothetical protein
MAKDLPYFKFNVSEWITGDITTCSMSAQGLFINLCAWYWSREGKLTMDLALKKFSQNNKDFDELFDCGVISENDEGLMGIKFLDEQLHERLALSEKNSMNSKLGVEARKAVTDRAVTERLPSGQPAIDRAVTNIEERRGEKKRGEKSYTNPFNEMWPVLIPRWDEYMEFRRELKKPIKSQISERKAISELFNLSQKYNNTHTLGLVVVAEFIINQSISKGWLGLFEPKITIPAPESDRKAISHDEYFT